MSFESERFKGAVGAPGSWSSAGWRTGRLIHQAAQRNLAARKKSLNPGTGFFPKPTPRPAQPNPKQSFGATIPNHSIQINTNDGEPVYYGGKYPYRKKNAFQRTAYAVESFVQVAVKLIFASLVILIAAYFLAHSK